MMRALSNTRTTLDVRHPGEGRNDATVAEIPAC